MKLFHLYSRALDGFYQSDVVVVAANREAAIDQVEKGVMAFLDNRLEEDWVARLRDPATNEFVERSKWDYEPDELPALRERQVSIIRAEAIATLVELETGYIVFERS